MARSRRLSKTHQVSIGVLGEEPPLALLGRGGHGIPSILQAPKRLVTLRLPVFKVGEERDRATEANNETGSAVEAQRALQFGHRKFRDQGIPIGIAVHGIRRQRPASIGRGLKPQSAHGAPTVLPRNSGYCRPIKNDNTCPVLPTPRLLLLPVNEALAPHVRER